MTFKELEIGTWFVLPENTSMVYLKMTEITDRFDNTIIAANENGDLFDNYDISPDTKIIPCTIYHKLSYITP